MTKNKTRGQALVEYLLVLVFSVFLIMKMIGYFTEFFSDSVGNLGHILTIDLSTGICEDNCYFSGFINDKGS